jgi:hypothetical protein
MAETLAEVLQSELGSWFGMHEVGRGTVSGGQEVRLKPGGHQDAIDLVLRLDAGGRIESATLLLDRDWIAAPATAPFAADLLKSALPILAPGDGAVAELVQRIERRMAAPNVIMHAGAMPAPLPPPTATVAAALAVYDGTQASARLDDDGATLLLENVSAAGTNRLCIIAARQAPRAANGAASPQEDAMADAAAIDLLACFLQAADLPAGMTMPQDNRASGPDPSDQHFSRFGGLKAGLARWHSPDGPAGRLIDIRWLFPNERAAADYHRTALAVNAEGLPEVPAAPPAGDECRVYGGLLLDPATRAMLGDRATPMARYLYLFRVGPVVTKLFMADVNDKGLTAELAGEIARNAAARTDAALRAAGIERGRGGVASAGGDSPGGARSWWRRLLGR